METLDEITRKIDYRDNSQRARNVTLAFYAIIVINLIAVVSDYFQIRLLENFNETGFVSDEEANSNDLRQMIVGLLQSAIFITTSVLFLVWFYRAYRNLHTILNERKMMFSKSMSVWGFIIPIISLFRPVQITNEITDKHTKILTRLNPEYKRISNKTLIGVWWTFFIITNFVQNIAFRTILKDDGTIENLILSTKAYVIADLLEIPAAIITFIMIKQISKEETLIANKIDIIEELTTPKPQINTTEEE